MTYDEGFYEAIREGCQAAAEVIVPLVHGIVQPQSVVDVGCGEGWFGKAFAEAGCRVLGVEGEHVVPRIPSANANLEEPLPAGNYDLAVCLEVAEHLSPKRAKSFVKELCDLAPVVLFSAAIPGQGGEGHQNEQWPAYWCELFEANGFNCTAALRWAIWNDERIPSWYRQNLLLASREPLDGWFDTPLAYPHPVVHPAFFGDLMAFIHNMAQQGKIEWR